MSFNFELRTEHPLDLYKADGLLRSAPVIRAQAERVGVVTVCDDPALNAHGHFTTYFGVVPVRPWYKNPAQSDLFITHEITHTEQFRKLYGRPVSFQDWAREMIDTELEASLLSECYVYLDVPGLRKHTFKHEIWMDRFLRHPVLMRLPGARAYVRRERLRVMAAPAFNDYVERQIWNYGLQNAAWCCIWGRPAFSDQIPEHAEAFRTYGNKPAFRIVEEHMAALNPGSPGWLDRHRSWLDTVTPGEGVPFPLQAEAFAKVYEQSVANFGNDVLLA